MLFERIPEERCSDMWERWIEPARRAMFFAQKQAESLGENFVATDHLLYGLVYEEGTTVVLLLDRMGISHEEIRNELERHFAQGEGRSDADMQLGLEGMRVVDFAHREMRYSGDTFVGTEHLLIGILQEGSGLTGRIMAQFDVELESTRSEIRTMRLERRISGACLRCGLTLKGMERLLGKTEHFNCQKHRAG